MPRFRPYEEELLDFLLTRLDEADDEADFACLVTHEPKQMMAAYMETGGGRCETRTTTFTGCTTCSVSTPAREFGHFAAIDIEAWPCGPVRLLALRFADDPDYRYWWKPEHADFVSGKLVHQEADRIWPWQLPRPSDSTDGE